jgi:aldose 1-epimerase
VLAGRERLLTEPAAGIDPPIAWGCYVMAPFVGRIRDGHLSWGGRMVQLPLNHGSHAIHGAVFDRPWQVVEQTTSSLTLACAFEPERWPFRGSMTQKLSIGRGQATIEAEILADDPMPAAIGWHPWFRSDGATLRVAVQSDATLRLEPGLIPTGELEPIDERTDLRAGPGLAGHRLDDVYAATRSPMVVEWPDLELVLAFEKPVGCAVVFNHPQAACVEPMTAWPDAINLQAAGRTDTGLVSLAAGERLRATTRLTWTPGPGNLAAKTRDTRSSLQ